MNNTLFRQLFRSKAFIISICVLPLIAFGIFQIKSIHYSNSKSALTETAIILKEPIIDYLKSDNLNELNQWLLSLETPTRITVMAPNGIVLADSKADARKMENHKQRPEIQTAQTGTIGYSIRNSFTLDQESMYIAVPVLLDQAVPYVIRTSVAINLLSQYTFSMTINLILLSGFLLFLAGLISYMSTLKLTRPLNTLKRAAERIAKGNFSTKVPISNAPEFAQVGDAMNKMMTQLADRIRTITHERNEKEQILRNMTDGIFLLDKKHEIQSINAATARMIGLVKKQVLHQPIQSVITEQSLITFIEKSIHTRETIEDIVTLTTGHESPHYFHVHGTPIFSRGTARYGTLILLSDVTHIRKLESLRQEFVANVSHELRTPITLIKGFTETLLDGAIENQDDANRFVTIIQNHTARIESIIDNLMQLSRLEKEGSGVNKEIIIVDKLIENAISAVKNFADNEEVQLEYASNGIKIYGNQRLFEQAIINFLNNAIRYSKKNERVIISCKQKNEMVWISVQDFGCGVAPEHLPKLFQRFYRVDKARARAGGGTGLGLAIVKHIVQTHGGTVSVDSKINQGSTFTIALPDQYH